MNTYIIRELQDAASTRKGQTIEAKGLAAAKRVASRAQFFQWTVLTIEQDGIVLATKENGRGIKKTHSDMLTNPHIAV